MYSSNSAKKGIASRVARCKMKLPYSKNFIKVGSNTSNENYIAIRQGNVRAIWVLVAVSTLQRIGFLVQRCLKIDKIHKKDRNHLRERSRIT